MRITDLSSKVSERSIASKRRKYLGIVLRVVAVGVVVGVCLVFRPAWRLPSCIESTCDVNRVGVRYCWIDGTAGVLVTFASRGEGGMDEEELWRTMRAVRDTVLAHCGHPLDRVVVLADVLSDRADVADLVLTWDVKNGTGISVTLEPPDVTMDELRELDADTRRVLERRVFDLQHRIVRNCLGELDYVSVTVRKVHRSLGKLKMECTRRWMRRVSEMRTGVGLFCCEYGAMMGVREAGPAIQELASRSNGH